MHRQMDISVQHLRRMVSAIPAERAGVATSKLFRIIFTERSK